MTLYLTLQKKWFDLILNGQKKEEFREIKPYWTKRLFKHPFKQVQFRNGYQKDAPTFVIECKGIDYYSSSNDLGLDSVIRIKLGKIISKKNIPS